MATGWLTTQRSRSNPVSAQRRGVARPWAEFIPFLDYDVYLLQDLFGRRRTDEVVVLDAVNGACIGVGSRVVRQCTNSSMMVPSAVNLIQTDFHDAIGVGVQAGGLEVDRGERDGARGMRCRRAG